jgi:hypothetical protein
MKKLLLLNILSVALGGHLLAGYQQGGAQRHYAPKAQMPVKNGPKKQFKRHDKSCSSSSSSSSRHHSCKVVCCEKHEAPKPVYASAVANGSANQQFVAPGNPIVFNTVENISPNVFYNSSTGVFTVNEPGTYEIIYGARFTGAVCISEVGNTNCTCCTEPEVCHPLDDFEFDPCASIALQINGVEVSGSQVNSADLFEEDEVASADWVSIALIQTVSAGTTFAVTAAQSDEYGIQLLNSFGFCETCDNGDTTAFVTIKRIG